MDPHRRHTNRSSIKKPRSPRIAFFSCFTPHCVCYIESVLYRKLSALSLIRMDQPNQPSFQASNAIIYLTYGAFLLSSSMLLVRWSANALTRRISGLIVAWHFRNQSKTDFLASNRTQKGQKPISQRPTRSPPLQTPSTLHRNERLTTLISCSIGPKLYCLG